MEGQKICLFSNFKSEDYTFTLKVKPLGLKERRLTLSNFTTRQLFIQRLEKAMSVWRGGCGIAGVFTPPRSIRGCSVEMGY